MLTIKKILQKVVVATKQDLIIKQKDYKEKVHRYILLKID